MPRDMEDGLELNADMQSASIKDKLKAESKPVKSLPNSESIPKEIHQEGCTKLNGDCEGILNNDQNSKPEVESKSTSDVADVTINDKKICLIGDEDDDDFEPMTTRSRALLSSLAASSEITIQRVTKDTEKFERNDKVPKPEITVSKPKTRSQSIDSSIEKGKTNETKKTQKRKNEDDKEIVEKFPIQYKGFKKKNPEQSKSGKKFRFKWNPFNPAASCKREKMSKRHLCDTEDDSSTLQSEYAQYLGLQPILKFKCSNCGMSSFQSMSALNSHQVECKKLDKPPGHQTPVNPVNEQKSAANIKLTRKVFLCSACGTYYEHWNLFLHMREVHRRYICLFCLGMFSVADKLSEHLIQKHNVTKQDFVTYDDYTKYYPSFYLLCLSCDKVFCENDSSMQHNCKSKNNELEITIKQDVNLTKTPDNHPATRLGGRRTRETNKRKETVALKSIKKDIKTENDVPVETPLKLETPVKLENENKIEEDILPPPEIIKTAVSEVEDNNKNETKSQENKEINENINLIPTPARVMPKRVKKVKRLIKRSVKKKPISKSISKPISTPISTPIEVPQEESILPQEPIVPDSEPVQMEIPPEKRINLIQDSLEIKEDIKKEDIKKEEIKEEKIDVPQNKNQEFDFTNQLQMPKSLFKLKLHPGLESDGESDDSQKLSLIVDEQASSATNSDGENKLKINQINENSMSETSCLEEPNQTQEPPEHGNEISLAGEEVAVMALALDDKIENVSIQTVVKECVRTSCLTCNYCRHASKIAVNGKLLALHLLSEHRYMPTKNETTEDVINKLKQSLDDLSTMFFNSETYDSTDPSLYVPYDQELRFNCFQCNHDALSHKDLYAHKKKYHSKSLLLCIMCKSTFVSYSELICHVCPGKYSAEILNIDMKFRCCLCPIDSIPSGFRLMVHLRKSHHMCDICLEICQDQQKLSTHMWKHKLNHLCYRCGISYASKPDITKHLFWKHGTESVLCKKCLQKKWPHVYHFCIPPTSFICEECNTSFSKAVALKVHKRVHGSDIPYPCTICDKKFVSKKLLLRHEERHRKPVKKEEIEVEKEDDKDEIINVTDINDENQEPEDKKPEIAEDDNKENKPAEKVKKKADLNIPPLNLSSDSEESSDDEDEKPITEDIKEENSNIQSPNEINEESPEDLKNILPESESLVKPDIMTENTMCELKGDLDLPQPPDNTNITEALNSIEPLVNIMDQPEKLLDIANLPFVNNFTEQLLSDTNPSLENPIDHNTTSNTLNLTIDENLKINQDDKVGEIWENFYKTNPQNSSLPYPLCAMKSEVAYGIIMADHDYCQRTEKPIIREELPLSMPGLSDDKLEETSGIEKKVEVKEDKSESSKKKVKSPKKKTRPSRDSSSSSSDSSDTDSSTCSCGTNCTCSSKTSSSSSSSSSDSDSSGEDSKTKTPKKHRRSKTKSEHEKVISTSPQPPREPEVVETSKEEPEPVKAEDEQEHIIVEPEDSPIRESELETDETSSDEEFYDSQPQRKVSQIIAEKRHQLIQAAGLPNNGNLSPAFPMDSASPNLPYSLTPVQSPVLTPVAPLSKSRVRSKRMRKSVPKIKVPIEKPAQSRYQYLNTPKSFSQYPQYQDLKPPVHKSPFTPTDNTPSGSENDSSRSSKRRRIPNKFYGYSSGEEDDKTPMKWRKLEYKIATPAPTIVQQPTPPPPHVPTPRIQLTVPKQVIKRRPKVNKIKPANDSDSGTEEIRRPKFLQTGHHGSRPHPHLNQPQPGQKPEKDVYCYCRCPYDEVSEMIACDDENCTIEWFHFECVGILLPPRGEWFCPGCRKARGLPPA